MSDPKGEGEKSINTLQELEKRKRSYPETLYEEEIFQKSKKLVKSQTECFKVVKNTEADCRQGMSSVEESVSSPTGKRQDYLCWDDYFMATAFLAAQRSKDPCTQVGACIVNSDNKIVGVGYNGFPKGCSDDEFPWEKDAPLKLDRKGFYVCHAEANAILNKNVSDTKNCRIFVALFPCNECAKIIIQSGITEVIYMSDKNLYKDKVQASIKMFDAAGIKYKKFQPQKRKIIIDFDQVS